MRRGAPAAVGLTGPARGGFGESPLRSVAAVPPGRKALRPAVNGTEPRLPAPGWLAGGAAQLPRDTSVP
jgi:hypothetical protein